MTLVPAVFLTNQLQGFQMFEDPWPPGTALVVDVDDMPIARVDQPDGSIETPFVMVWDVVMGEPLGYIPVLLIRMLTH